MKIKRRNAYLLLLLVSAIWGIAGPVIKYVLAYLPPDIFLTYRFGISFLIAVIYAVVTRATVPRQPKRLFLMLLSGFLSISVALGLLFFGYDKTTALSGSLISTVSPLMVIFLGYFFLRDHITKTERLGIGLAFLGTLITTVAPLAGGLTAAAVGGVQGNALIIASMLADAFGTLTAKVSVREHVDPTTFTHVSFAVGFASILPFCLLWYSPYQIITTVSHAPLPAHLGVLYMAVMSGTLAYLLRNKAIKTVEISESAVFTYLYPLWAAPLALFWLGEQLTLGFLAGGAVIAAGVFIAEKKWHRDANGSGKRRHRRHRK